MKTLLCTWYGEPLYEEDVPREKLIEIVKFLAASERQMREQYQKDFELLKIQPRPLKWYEKLILKL